MFALREPYQIEQNLCDKKYRKWTGTPAGGLMLVDCGDNSSGNAGGSELIWDSQAGVGASQPWVYSLTNILSVAAASLTSTNPVDLTSK